MSADASPSAAEKAPPWIEAQCRQLLASPGQALLLQGPSGLGQCRLALALARGWLCEANAGTGACGVCNSCHAIDVRTHADLHVLMPETQLLALNWPLGEKAQAEVDDKKRKPSREIRVDAMRDAIEFSQRTSARGRGKVVLVFPAEQMNAITANALLKTLEEPPGAVRFVLATESAHQLLPTIRSRCLCHSMQWPESSQSLAWLADQGLSANDAHQFLRISGDRPEDALLAAHSGMPASLWQEFPAAMQAGNVALVRDWSPAILLDSLQKLCHDTMVVSCGAAPRFFDVGALKGLSSVTIAALSAWSGDLRQARKTVDHPFNPGLMQEALVDQARIALNSARI